MPNIKRLIDLSSYKGVLPYDSELFGVYQPLIGWKSRRKVVRIGAGVQLEQGTLIGRLSQFFRNTAPIGINVDCAVSWPGMQPAGFIGTSAPSNQSFVVQAVAAKLATMAQPDTTDAWRRAVNADTLGAGLGSALAHWNDFSISGCRQLAQQAQGHTGVELFRAHILAQRDTSGQRPVHDKDPLPSDTAVALC